MTLVEGGQRSISINAHANILSAGCFGFLPTFFLFAFITRLRNRRPNRP